MRGGAARSLAAYGQSFDVEYPQTGTGLVTLATIDTSAHGQVRAESDRMPLWTAAVDVQTWPDLVDPDQQIVGPDLYMRIQSGQGATRGLEQIVPVPARGIAIPATGAVVRVDLFAVPNPGILANGRIAGTLQVRSGQPQAFMCTDMRNVAAAGASSGMPIPPFALLWKPLYTSSTVLNADFYPVNGGKVASYAMSNSSVVRAPWLPIPRGAGSVIITNAGAAANSVAMGYKGQI